MSTDAALGFDSFRSLLSARAAALFDPWWSSILCNRRGGGANGESKLAMVLKTELPKGPPTARTEHVVI
ncbi:predicted protein [Pyrenophora tritici-repentis Pt-1C-BFP]|uniref:Uncharacterized protein n=1 Tax=Pyrenophora tritici-repentis (strain Pt-1C-BFP) TaxID=426418 RepID=B2WEK8_PYRTR|nr:uncharacterized protein PTRG_08581 [Pyrenophora tritici-repentis Pt-1C-BFP]EDU51500.1 predicted protein [Pyrenophora tritici-repentis Pt-1C-BFP]